MKLRITLAFVCTSLFMLSHSASFAAIKKNEDPSDKKVAKKVSTSRNNSSVRIYPDAFKRSMHVVAKDAEGTGIDFFVFDLQGTIVKHYKMQSGEHQNLHDLDR